MKKQDVAENNDTDREVERNSSVVACKEGNEEASQYSENVIKRLKGREKRKRQHMTENSDSNHEVVEVLNSMVWNSTTDGSSRIHQGEKRKRVEETKCRIEEVPCDESAIDKASGDQRDRSLPISDSPLTTAISTRKKLLVLDLNGLLADIVASFSKEFTPDTSISGKALFKRPFCDEFLHCCFERFNVGIWSSTTRKNVDLVVNFLMGSAKKKLLFCWPNTAVFPYPCDYRDKKDRSVGPGGDLCIYLERLADADDVQAFVEASPFGQSPITQTNESWPFYAKIIGAKDDKQQNSNIVVATVWCGTRKKF